MVTVEQCPSSQPSFEKDREKEIAESSQQVIALKEQLETTDVKLDRLLDAHLEGVLGAAEYKAKKDQLLG